MRRIVVGVVGPSEAEPEERSLARRTGRLLARAGWIVATGGLGGVMEEASRGAAEEGGTVLGILPGGDPSAANPWVTIPIVTGLGEARNLVLVHTSALLVAIGGGAGTLSEIAFALKQRKPVVALRTWRLEPGRLSGAAWFEVGTAEEAFEEAARILGSRDVL